MDTNESQLICFFYLLTRGTPNSPGMPWGQVKELIREVGGPERRNFFTSRAGEAMARELAYELMTGERAPDERALFERPSPNPTKPDTRRM